MPANASKIKTKTVHFFRMHVLDNGSRRFVNDFDWLSVLEAARAAAPQDRRASGDVLFDPNADEDHLIIGFHSPLSTDFVSVLDSATDRVVDYMKTEGAAKLFRSTAVVCLPEACFGVCRTSNAAPGASHVTDFLQKFAPQGQGIVWQHGPLFDRSKLARLRQAKGIVEFSAQVDTQTDLFTGEALGVASILPILATQVGGELEVTIGLKLKDAYRNDKTQGKFLESVLAGVDRLAGKGSRARAKAIFPDGLEQELELVEHRLCTTFDLDTSTSEAAQFTQLLAELRIVRGDMETAVRANLSGDPDA
jgi:hypothetical protein